MPVRHFTPLALTDYGYTYKTGNEWTPVDVAGFLTSANNSVYASYVSADSPNQYSYSNGYVRYDTQAIPDVATIISAELRLYIYELSAVTADAKDLIIEWISPTDNWPISAATVSTIPVTNKQAAIVPLSGLTTGLNIIPLTGALENVNKSGYTAVRLMITPTGTPTGVNKINFLGSSSFGISYEYSSPVVATNVRTVDLAAPFSAQTPLEVVRGAYKEFQFKVRSNNADVSLANYGIHFTVKYRETEGAPLLTVYQAPNVEYINYAQGTFRVQLFPDDTSGWAVLRETNPFAPLRLVYDIRMRRESDEDTHTLFYGPLLVIPNVRDF